MSERSHGKMRPGLTRSSDLQPDAPGTGPERPEDRDEQGRAAVGNQLARGRGWKAAIRKHVAGGQATTEEAARIERDAWTVYLAILRDLASTGPLVRVNAAGVAREFAVAGFFDAKALEEGLMTEKGAELAHRASMHRQRAERLSVTVKDLARVSVGRRVDRPIDRIRRDLAKGGTDAE